MAGQRDDTVQRTQQSDVNGNNCDVMTGVGTIPQELKRRLYNTIRGKNLKSGRRASHKCAVAVAIGPAGSFYGLRPRQ